MPSPKPRRTWRFDEFLSVLWIPVALVWAPFAVVRDLLARRAIRRLEARAPTWRSGDLQLAGAELVFSEAAPARSLHQQAAPPPPPHRWALETIERIEITHIDGDGGFADANSQYDHAIVVFKTGERFGLNTCDSHPYPISAAYKELHRMGLATLHPEIKGRAGCGLVYLICAGWLLVALVAAGFWVRQH